MAFVRWHYRDGVYVRSHFRRVTRARTAGQRPLLALVATDRARQATRLPADAPPRPVLHDLAAQTALQLREA
jgi:hypothetical protein